MSFNFKNKNVYFICNWTQHITEFKGVESSILLDSHILEFNI